MTVFLKPKDQKPRPKKRRTRQTISGEVIDGIRYRRSKATGEMQEFCVTLKAKALRREDVWMQAKGRCQLCAKDLHPNFWDWDHIIHRSLGGDDSVKNGRALCKFPSTPNGAVSCHTLVHRPELDRNGKMTNGR